MAAALAVGDGGGAHYAARPPTCPARSCGTSPRPLQCFRGGGAEMDLVNPIVRRWLEEGEEDPDGFWARAADELPWFRKWDRAFEWERPSFRWFVGGETNLAYNALDHHVARGRGGHAALVYLNERGERRVFTYAQLLHEVERIAAALRGIGRRQGRPGHDLHADLPRRRSCSCSRPSASARSTPSSSPASARRRSATASRRAARGRLHGRRHLSQGQGDAAQGDRRRRARALAARSSSRWSS